MRCFDAWNLYSELEGRCAEARRRLKTECIEPAEPASPGEPAEGEEPDRILEFARGLDLLLLASRRDDTVSPEAEIWEERY